MVVGTWVMVVECLDICFSATVYTIYQMTWDGAKKWHPYVNRKEGWPFLPTGTKWRPYVTGKRADHSFQLKPNYIQLLGGSNHHMDCSELDQVVWKQQQHITPNALGVEMCWIQRFGIEGSISSPLPLLQQPCLTRIHSCVYMVCALASWWVIHGSVVLSFCQSCSWQSPLCTAVVHH